MPATPSRSRSVPSSSPSSLRVSRLIASPSKSVAEAESLLERATAVANARADAGIDLTPALQGALRGLLRRVAELTESLFNARESADVASANADARIRNLVDSVSTSDARAAVAEARAAAAEARAAAAEARLAAAEPAVRDAALLDEISAREAGRLAALSTAASARAEARAHACARERAESTALSLADAIAQRDSVVQAARADAERTRVDAEARVQAARADAEARVQAARADAEHTRVNADARGAMIDALMSFHISDAGHVAPAPPCVRVGMTCLALVGPDAAVAVAALEAVKIEHCSAAAALERVVGAAPGAQDADRARARALELRKSAESTDRLIARIAAAPEAVVIEAPTPPLPECAARAQRYRLRVAAPTRRREGGENEGQLGEGC